MGMSTIGGIIGNIAGKSDRDAADNAFNQAMGEIRAVGAPPDLSKEIILNKFKQAGILTPELEQAVNIEHSKVSQIQEDPNLKSAQMDALGALKQYGHGGLSAGDRTAYKELRNQSQRDLEAKRQQIQSNFAARGQGGSGNELIAQLQAAQAGANEESNQGDRLAAQASQNALQALLSGGQLGGQIRGQDFNVNNTKASAEDEMNRFNTQNQIARQQRNVASQNNAQESNLANLQNINNANASMANKELDRQNQAKRQFWQDKTDQADRIAGTYKQESGRFANRAAGTAQMGAQIGSGIDKALATGMGMMKPTMGGDSGGGNSSAFSGIVKQGMMNDSGSNFEADPNDLQSRYKKLAYSQGDS